MGSSYSATPSDEEIRTWVRDNADDLVEAVGAHDLTGFCVVCGEETSPVEPDAKGHECPDCGAKAVYGAEELLLYS